MKYLTMPIPVPNHKNVKGIPIPSKTLSYGSKALKLYKLRTNVEILKHINSFEYDSSETNLLKAL